MEVGGGCDMSFIKVLSFSIERLDIYLLLHKNIMDTHWKH